MSVMNPSNCQEARNNLRLLNFMRKASYGIGLLGINFCLFIFFRSFGNIPLGIISALMTIAAAYATYTAIQAINHLIRIQDNYIFNNNC